MTGLKDYITSYFGIEHSDELDKVSSLFTLTPLKKAEYFLKEGKVCDQFCFIQTGILRIFTIPDDREITQWITTKGYFGTDFSSFFFETPSRWTIQALTDAEIYTIKKKCN